MKFKIHKWYSGIYKIIRIRRRIPRTLKVFLSGNFFLDSSYNMTYAIRCERNSPDKHGLQRNLYSQYGGYISATLL